MVSSVFQNLSRLGSTAGNQEFKYKSAMRPPSKENKEKTHNKTQTGGGGGGGW